MEKEDTARVQKKLSFLPSSSSSSSTILAFYLSLSRDMGRGVWAWDLLCSEHVGTGSKSYTN